MRYFISFLLCFLGPIIFGQLLGDGSTIFTFKVKQVDEFIKRFNNDPKTLANQYKIETGGHPLSRKENILSLFDHNKDWNETLIKTFLKKTLSNKAATFVDFFDKDWYAKVNCTFSYKNKDQFVNLILQNQLQSNGGSKWVIVSIIENLAFPKCEDIPESHDPYTSLNPMSHATDFVALHKAFKDKQNLGNYFDEWNQQDEFIGFKHAILNETITFVQTNTITYHFLQLEDWVFTLNYYPRNSRNSGWLISDLI